jgi:hypothetical protein
VNIPDSPKKSWFERARLKAREIRSTYGTEVTVPRVLGFVVARLLAEGVRYLVHELWKDLMRPW